MHYTFSTHINFLKNNLTLIILLLSIHTCAQGSYKAYFNQSEAFTVSENKLFRGVTVSPLSIYADSMSLNIDDIISQESSLNWEIPTKINPQRGVVYWLRTSFIGNESFHGSQVFHVSQELGKDFFASDFIDTYTINKLGQQSHQRTGRKVAQKNKPLGVWINLIELEIDIQDTLDVFIRLEGVNPNFPTAYYLLWHLDYEYFLSNQVGVAIRTAIFFGIMAIMILFFGFLYMIERDKIYIFFTLFATGLLCNRIFAEFNLDSFVLFPSLIEHFQKIFHASVFLTIAGGIYFMSSYLNIPKNGIFLKRVVPTYLVLNFLAIFTFLTRSPQIPGMQYYSEKGLFSLWLVPGVYTFLSIFFGIYMFIAAPKSKNSSKLFLMIAILPMIVGTALTVMYDMRLLPNFFTENMLNQLMKMSTVLLVLTLGLIVGYKSIRLKFEKELAISENLKAQQTIFEKQLRTEKLEEMNQLKTKLYTNITHEFRTPLTVILGMNDELVKTNQSLNISESKKKAIFHNQQLIKRNSENLLNLVNQLLDLSKSDNQELSLQLIQADVLPFLNYLIESFFSKANEKNIRLVFYTELDSLIMDYDEQQLQHILYNLLSNALKFTEVNGKIVLHASLLEKSNKRYAQLKVSDNGIGIEAEKLPYIFDRFYQVDDSATRQNDGSGIGLSLTKEIVYFLDGEITVKSKKGEGTVFTVLLPITNNAVYQKDSNAQTKEKYQERPIHAELDVGVPIDRPPIPIDDDIILEDQATILIVEDNNDVADYLKQILGNSYNTIRASNGELGITKAYDLIPDLIISDVMMPIKDGYQLTQTLKQDTRTSHIPVILLTAKATQIDKLSGLKQGADAYLYKPFNKEELFIRIERLLANRKAMQHFYLSSYVNEFSEVNSLSKYREEKEEQFLNQLREIIENDIQNNQLNADYLSSKIGVSQSQLYRKLKALVGETPNTFIRNIRLQKSLTLLKSTDLNISEIAYELGFTNPSYFSKSFHKKYGKSPLAYRGVKWNPE